MPTSKKIRCISFDLDGTLVDPVYNDWVWFRGIPELYARGKGLDFEKALAIVSREYDRVGDEDVRWYDIKFWFEYFSLGTNWKGVLNKFRHKACPYPEAKEVLQRLSGRYPLIIISNAAREFIDIEVDACDIRGYFSHIFSATSDFGEVKKTAGFYKKVLNEVGFNPHEIVHIGDHYRFDYLIPNNMGIRSYLLDRKGKRNEDSVVCDLVEFTNKL